MRDQERIPDMLKRIEKIWQEAPDMRLGQLILNVFSLHNGVDSRVYNMEDEEFIQTIEYFYGYLR